MHNRNSILLITVVLLVSLIVPATATAETRLTVVSSRPKVTIGAVVMPAAVDTSIVWIGDSLARIDKPDGSIFIYEQKSQTAFKLLPKFEMYQKTNFAAADTPDSIPAEQSLMAGLSKLVTDTSTHVEATADTSTVNGYHCRKYIVNETKAGLITVYKRSEVWATTDIGVNFELYKIITNIAELISAESLDGVKDLLQVNGVTVLRTGTITPAPDPDSIAPVINIAGGDRTELVKVEKLPAPAGLYEVPAGYEQTQ